jgi:hypothetical protein
VRGGKGEGKENETRRRDEDGDVTSGRTIDQQKDDEKKDEKVAVNTLSSITIGDIFSPKYFNMICLQIQENN